jgi:hypothetical protein
LKIFSHLIDNGLISTIDLVTKHFWLLLEFFWAMIEKFGHQLGQRKKIGEKFRLLNQANKIFGQWTMVESPPLI